MSANSSPNANANANASIPNLLSLRRGRGGLRGGHGRGRGPHGLGHSHGHGLGLGHGGPAATHEATVQGTDTDAAVSRLSAVDAGYLDDAYARYFVQNPDGPATRRLPIINRGTYTRTKALDTLVDAFLSEHGTAAKQIVSLGAGTDTRPFRLFARPSRPSLVYHEIDFPVTCDKKRRTVQATPVLRNILTAMATEADGSWSCKPANGGEFYFHGTDLRSLSEPSATSLPGLRTNVPTLLLSECCLCYLAPSEASRILHFFTSQIPSLATIIYEPIKPDDAFGKMMVSNLAARRIRMPTLHVYREPADQDQRLKDGGFDMVRHQTMEQVWDTWVPPEEKERVDSVEGLDEVEEWKLLAAHYIVVWGCKGDGFGSWASVGRGD